VNAARPSGDAATDVAHGTCVSIGGLTFRIVSGDPRLASRPYAALASFAGEPQNADVIVRAGWSDTPFAPGGDVIFDSGGTWRLVRSDGDFVFTFQSAAGGPIPYKTARFNATFTSGDVLLHREYFERHGLDAVYPLQFPLDELLMVHLLSQDRGMEIHGAALLDDAGRTYVFAGQSGAGKSTMSRLWAGHPGVTLLSDERVILRTDRDPIAVYGTPWHGDAMLASPRSGQLAGVFFLKHYPSNVLTRIVEPIAAARLLACSFLPFHDAGGVARTSAAAERVARSVPCYVLGFVPDASVVEILIRHMA
jgi:hypothetical protein